MEKLLGLNIWRVLIAIISIAILSIWQKKEDIRTVIFIISIYLVLVFIYSSIKAIRSWFT